MAYIGRNDNTSNITGSSATGAVTVGNTSILIGGQIGGLVGVNSSGSTISSSTASGTVSSVGSVTQVGGLVGYNNIQNPKSLPSTITQSTAMGNVIVGSG